MQPDPADWKAQAQAKVADTLSKIPEEWRLEEDAIKAAKNRRQLAGDFIFGLLDPETVKYISQDSKELVDLIAKKEYTSLQVTQAYCKIAAVAHQIVWTNTLSIFKRSVSISSVISLMRMVRIIVYMRFSLIRHSKGQKSSMITSRNMERR